MMCPKIESKKIKQVAQTFAFVIMMSIMAPCSTATSNITKTTSNWTTCEARDNLACRCTSDVLADVIARCHFNHVTDLKMIINTPQGLTRLNLSANNIQYIHRCSFKNYTHLIYLSLSSNKIQTISQAAFSGLTRLEELNLQDNLIKQWDTTLIEQDLPNLIMLNVAHNIYWKPDQQVLSLPNLMLIDLLWVPKTPVFRQPFKCYIMRRTLEKRRENYSFVENIPSSIGEEVTPNALFSRLDDCWRHKLYFRDDSYWDVINDSGFYFHCTMIKPREYPKTLSLQAAIVQERLHSWYYTMEIIIPYCWNSIRRIHIITLIIGICAIFFNLIVIITTVRSRVLRESVAHVLVANIAVGDLLIALYMIIITSTRQIMDSIEYHDLYLPHYCRIVGLFFLIGQILSPAMSFLMTLERYLAVVYCMRPHIRITRRMTCVAMVIVWTLSLALAVSFMTSPKFARRTEDMCIPVYNAQGKPVLYYLAGIGIFSYIIAIALYIHMYVDFKKTNQKTVQLQRENRLARRIALIMFTNVICFIIPFIVILIISFARKENVERFIFNKTFGFMCLCVNSCVNPILFSFRNERFRKEVRRIWSMRHPDRSVAPKPAEQN